VPRYRDLKYDEAVNNQLYNHIYDQSTVSLVMEEKTHLPTRLSSSVANTTSRGKRFLQTFLSLWVDCQHRLQETGWDWRSGS
ncbi:MAG: hypothetical protein MKZ70_05035, partial [Opitutales bacterium]|nr:hypothetical protein [Opitutales bacterium]